MINMAKEDFIFFWGGTFSQWCPSVFTIDGVDYNCSEQYMMAKKALLFGDTDAYREIMLEDEPATQKAIGRTVRGFNKEKWEQYCQKFVYDANLAKFKQNPRMLKELLATDYSKKIVEASPEDKIWGIGLRDSDSRALDESTWLGTNWLGIAIMKVRSTILNERFEL